MPPVLPLLHLRYETKEIRTAGSDGVAHIGRPVDFRAHDFLRHAAPLSRRERDGESGCAT